MSNALSKDYKFWPLLRFTAPTIIMMIFMSLYTMVDGVFVSNLISENALSAVNIVYPAQSILIAVAIMIATGGSAIIARQMGEGKAEEAKQNFTQFIVTGIIMGFIIMAVGLLFLDPIIKALGATPLLHDYCSDYWGTLLLFSPMAVLQMLFQFFFVAAGKPNMGLLAIGLGGVANLVLDYIFIEPLGMGIAGAAVATGIGYSIPAIWGLVYFATHKQGTLHFVRPKYRGAILWESCLNGSSEMVTNLATAITTYLFNVIMLRYLGENGVAAITIVLYAQFLLTAAYIGFSSGVAPVISYNYGEQNIDRLRRIFKYSTIFVGTTSLVTFVAAMGFAPYIVQVFVKPQSPVYALAVHGFVLFAFSYLFTGANIFASSLFTALSNGRVSATISFLRTFLFIVAGILLLPLVIGESGIWLAVPIAEAVALGVSLWYVLRLRKIYGYL